MDFLVSNIDYESFRGMLQTYCDLIPFSDDEIKSARRKYIESVFKDSTAYYETLFDTIGMFSSSYYFDDNRNLLVNFSD